MSNDTMPCGCEGHADNAGLCRYPALEAALEAEKRLTERNAETARSLLVKVDRAELDAKVAWDAHAREKAAREGWVEAYQQALTRAERAEAELAAIRNRASDVEGIGDALSGGGEVGVSRWLLTGKERP